MSDVGYETKKNARYLQGFTIGGIGLSGTKKYKTEGGISLWDDEELSFKHMLSVRCIWHPSEYLE